MDFDFSEEEQAISDLTQQIFEDKVTHEHLRSLTKSGVNFDRELWLSLAKTEWWAQLSIRTFKEPV